MQNSAPDMLLSLLDATEQAFTLASRGELSIVDLFNAAQRLTDAKHPDIAADLYRRWLANNNSPIAYAVQFNLGVVLNNANDDAGAEMAFRAALAQKPDFIEGNLSLAALLERTGRPDEALVLWRNVLAFANPTVPTKRGVYLQALNNLGRLLEIRNELSEAVTMLANSLKEDPRQIEVMSHSIYLRQKLCEWPLHIGSDGGEIKNMVGPTSVLAMLSLSDDPALQLETASRYISEKVLKDVHSMSSKQSYGHERLRIGYLALDLCTHSVSFPTAEFFGLHDRSKVEVFGFFGSPSDDSPLCARLIASLDHYFNILAKDDDEVACLIRSHEIDILVDLNGLDLGARHNILSYRPAPVQMSWLGLPCTTALAQTDYVVSDPFVLPPAMESYFTEKPLHMPHTFQVIVHQHAAGHRPTREGYGLPEDAVVFCCFNDNFKFSPEVFGTWMRILKGVPGSILWLAMDNERVRENLCNVAKKHGIARKRLHFAAPMASTDSLGCYQVADLYLDTFPFCTGPAAGDALWSALPVLTCAGQSFASRMTGSMLKTVDLPELITYSLQEYEGKAIELGKKREKIAAMRRQLDENRLTCPLFDTQRFVRDLEGLFRRVIDELPAAPAKPNSHASNLEYIEAPNATPNLNVSHDVFDRRYVIAAPPFQHNSAGIRVLYDLQKWLVRAGLDAIVCTWFEGYPIEQFADDIVIYPEVAPGNLLKANRVIRYILNRPGKLGYGEKTYDKKEVLVAYGNELAPYANGMILQVPSIEPFFHSKNCEKTVNAMFVGKGLDLGLHPADCISITKTYPATRREVARLLRSVKTLYTYDDFTMIAPEAQMCGCAVKLIQKDKTIIDFPIQRLPTMDEFKLQLHEFIEMTKRL